jgi:hypothetical protein
MFTCNSTLQSLPQGRSLCYEKWFIFSKILAT